MSQSLESTSEAAREPSNTAPPATVSRGARVVFWSLAIASVAAIWIWRDPWRNAVFAHGVLHNDAPTEEAMDRVIAEAKDQPAVLRAFWNSRHVVPREGAIRRLANFMPGGEPVPARFESWVQAAALDPDLNVRESALEILREHKDPSLAALCAAQLRDVDPEVRQLGLSKLAQVSAGVGVTSVIPLLQDSDPRIVASSLKMLENWTGQSFGVKLFDTIPTENKETGLMEFGGESVAKAKAGAERAKIWWEEHQSEYKPTPLEVPPDALAALEPVPAGDFSLSTLDGRPVRLSDFRGQVVVINFWATWCTACLGEMPELIALQRRHHDHLVILGVSLDSVPDEDDNPAKNLPSLKEIRQKMARTAEKRGLNYPILLDEKGRTGARFNGGELPTTVIVDAQGNIRRRFVGPRSLPVFEAMIAEASQPPKWTK